MVLKELRFWSGSVLAYDKKCITEAHNSEELISKKIKRFIFNEAELALIMPIKLSAYGPFHNFSTVTSGPENESIY